MSLTRQITNAVGIAAVMSMVIYLRHPEAAPMRSDETCEEAGRRRAREINFDGSDDNYWHHIPAVCREKFVRADNPWMRQSMQLVPVRVTGPWDTEPLVYRSEGRVVFDVTTQRVHVFRDCGWAPVGGDCLPREYLTEAAPVVGTIVCEPDGYRVWVADGTRWWGP